MKMIWPAIAGIAVASVIAMAAPVTAQPAADKEEAHEAVTVFAPYVVRRQAYRARGVKLHERLELLSVSRPVSFADLDLKDSAQQATLETRVQQAAKDACKELDRRFSKQVYIPVPEDQDCVKTATDEAMIQVKELIAAATAN